MVLHPAQRYDDFKLIRITCQAACHLGKTEHGIFVKFNKTEAKLLNLFSLPVSPSRVLRALGTSSLPCWCRSTKCLHPAQRYGDFKLIRITLPSRLSWQNWTLAVICNFFKNRAKLLLSSLSRCHHSGTPCPGDFIVPFGAEAPNFCHPAQRYDDY